MVYPDNYPASPTNRPSQGTLINVGPVTNTVTAVNCALSGDPITGAMKSREPMFSVVRIKLFKIENPKEEEALPIVAPSRHSLTLGQELRVALCRFLVNDSLIRHMQSLPDNAWGEVQCWVMFNRKYVVAFIQKLTLPNAESWCNSALPAKLEKTTSQIKCNFFQGRPLKAEALKSPCTDWLINTLEVQGFDVSQLRSSSVGLVLLADTNGQLHMFCISKEKKCIPFSPLVIHDEETNIRLPSEFSNLATKTVGIVGLGSAGSKIALSLWHGLEYEKFLLIDHDVFSVRKYLPSRT